MAALTERETPAVRRFFGDHPLKQLRQKMEEELQSVFGDTELFQASSEVIPQMDASETDAEMEVQTDLPGFKPEEVNIEINDNYLTISVTHSEEQNEERKDRRYHRVERRSGSSSRSVLLPGAVKQDGVDAELKEGVLTVTLPKSEQARRQKITVKG